MLLSFRVLNFQREGSCLHLLNFKCLITNLVTLDTQSEHVLASRVHAQIQVVVASVSKLSFNKLACSFRLTRLLRLISLAHFHFQKRLLLALGNRTSVFPALISPLWLVIVGRFMSEMWQEITSVSPLGKDGVGCMKVLYSLNHKARSLQLCLIHRNFQVTLLSVTLIKKTEVISSFVSIRVYFKSYIKLFVAFYTNRKKTAGNLWRDSQ